MRKIVYNLNVQIDGLNKNLNDSETIFGFIFIIPVYKSLDGHFSTYTESFKKYATTSIKI